MARAAPPSDDDDQPIVTSPTANDAENGDEVEEVPKSEPDAEEDEEEYEIEVILDAKKGMFEGGRVGYFVKWKGYSEEHNSWVDQQDAGNAQDLIDAFWKQRKDKARRKSTNEVKPPAKDRRKSAINVSDEEAPTARKRGRPSKGSNDVKEEEPHVAKKPKKAKGKEQSTVPSEDEILSVGNMGQYMNVQDWEPLIRSVDTVVSEEPGHLEVYFTLNSGEHVRENAKLCREKFPQSLISFYEAHLKWRATDVDAEP